MACYDSISNMATEQPLISWDIFFYFFQNWLLQVSRFDKNVPLRGAEESVHTFFGKCFDMQGWSSWHLNGLDIFSFFSRKTISRLCTNVPVGILYEKHNAQLLFNIFELKINFLCLLQVPLSLIIPLNKLNYESWNLDWLLVFTIRASKRNYVRRNKTVLGPRGHTETSKKIEALRFTGKLS
jgi:hypothetical protein